MSNLLRKLFGMIYIRPKDPYKGAGKFIQNVRAHTDSRTDRHRFHYFSCTIQGLLYVPSWGFLNIPFRGWKWWLAINLFLWCLRGTYIANPDVFQGFTTFHVPPPPTLGTIGCCAALWWWVARLLGPVGIKWQWFFASITQARKWPWKLLG